MVPGGFIAVLLVLGLTWLVFRVVAMTGAGQTLAPRERQELEGLRALVDDLKETAWEHRELDSPLVRDRDRQDPDLRAAPARSRRVRLSPSGRRAAPAPGAPPLGVQPDRGEPVGVRQGAHGVLQLEPGQPQRPHRPGDLRATVSGEPTNSAPVGPVVASNSSRVYGAQPRSRPILVNASPGAGTSAPRRARRSRRRGRAVHGDRQRLVAVARSAPGGRGRPAARTAPVSRR